MKSLEQIGQELNNILFDENQKDKGWINTRQKPAKVKRAIIDAAELLEPEDEIPEETAQILRNFGIELPSEESEEKEAATEVAEDESEPEEKEPKKKEKKPTKIEKNKYGHKVGTQADTIDKILMNTKRALTTSEIAEKANLKNARVASHLRHLIKEKQIPFEQASDKYLIEK